MLISALLSGSPEEVTRINSALANREKIMADQFNSLEAKGKLQINRAAMEKSIRAQITKQAGAKIDTAKMNALCPKVEVHILRKFGSSLGGEYFGNFYDKVKVRDFFDLSDPKLPDDLKLVVEYFKTEYGQDASTTRVLLVDGLPVDTFGVGISPPTHGTAAEIPVDLSYQGQKLSFTTVLELANPQNVSIGATREIFGSADFILINYQAFKKQRTAMLTLVAHELRHIIDRQSQTAALRSFTEAETALSEHLKKNRATMRKSEVEAALQSPQLEKYMQAVRIVALRDDPTAEKHPALKPHLAKVRKEIADSAAEGLLNSFVYRNNEYERRAYLEQARFAKVALGWDLKRYIQSMTWDLPYTQVEAAEMAASTVTLPSGEKVPTALLPSPPYEALFHSQMFESKDKVSVP